MQSERSSRAEPVVINDRCKCSHDRFRHNWGSENDGACSKPDCDCKTYDPVTVETVELPDPHECDNCNGYDPSTCMFNRPAGEAPPKAEIGPLPPPEGPEYTPCACGHIEPEHDINGKYCAAEPCDCVAYRPSPEHPSYMDVVRAWAGPPQPQRRPPLTVHYSVAGGNLYEVSIPGDASVTAEDGVLIIKHPSAQILAITRVAPMEGP